MTQVAVQGQIWNYEEIRDGLHGRPQALSAQAGSPLLVLHGWGRSGNEWIEMAKELSACSGRKAYVVDLPGFGGSSLPKVKDIYEYTELVVKFCEYLSIDKVILVGHSLGGRVGIVLGAKHSKLVEQLVLIDPAGVKPNSIKRTIFKTIAIFFAWIPPSLRAKIVARVMDEDYRNSPTTRELYKAIVKDDLRICLPHIKCKTWVIWGEKDKILPLVLVDIYKKLLPYPVVRVIWEAGHDPHLSHPQKLLRVLEELWT